jgi:hypothetical protein
LDAIQIQAGAQTSMCFTSLRGSNAAQRMISDSSHIQVYEARKWTLPVSV